MVSYMNYIIAITYISNTSIEHNSCRTFFNLLFCTAASKGGYEYIYCYPGIIDSIQSSTCYLNPHCPDRYVYLHTVVSDERHERCDEPYHHLQVSPVQGDFWRVYWSDPEGDDDPRRNVALIIEVRTAPNEIYFLKAALSLGYLSNGKFYN